MNARRRGTNSETGASLVIVLMVITVFGLIVAGLLTENDASIKYTNTVSNHQDKVYAADAGIQHAIQQLRQNNEVCADSSSSGPAIPSIEVGGKAVKVECTSVSGSTFGGSGFAVITTATGNNSLVLSNAHAKKIDGPVFVSGGIDWGPGVDSTSGNFYQKAGSSSCVLGASKPAKLDVESPYQYFCTDLARPDPPHAPPTTIPPAAPASTGSNACRVYYPGRYTAVPSGLSSASNVYFASGVYYFDFDDVMSFKQQTVIGGQPASHEQRALTAPSCATADPAGVSGSGVLFVLGNKARMYVDTQGELELFARNDPADGGSQQMSIVGVPDDWVASGWTKNTLSNMTRFLDIKSGNQQKLAVHGLIYAPNQSLGLAATNDVVAQTLGGMVVYSLEIESSASASNLAVSVAAGPPDPREILLTATAEGSDPGERSVVSSAVIEVDNDSAHTVSVKSWRTRGPSDS